MTAEPDAAELRRTLFRLIRFTGALETAVGFGREVEADLARLLEAQLREDVRPVGRPEKLLDRDAISAELIREVVRLHLEGRSRRAIHRSTGLSRRQVNNILPDGLPDQDGPKPGPSGPKRFPPGKG